jgi:hypothetical protein
MGGIAFFQEVLRKHGGSAWFFVVKAWWIAGESVVLRRHILSAKKNATF